MANAYTNFRKCLGVAMGKEEAKEAKRQMTSGDDVEQEDIEPEDAIQEQADKIADCISTYLVKLKTTADDKEVVKVPPDGPTDWP
ncbi:hypothetical protein CMI37_00710 [Candidatus Pacearchaeota archaeon]|nr:hypothetical protein [Candidatus Pacearchaeota archaeon]|tara:strand:+ start:2160 stop:2414 length:255 start_codon:yes stop_codon:yes gene_type:complete